MVAVVPQDDRLAVPVKRHTVGTIDSRFKDAGLALHLLRAQRGMTPILAEPTHALENLALHGRCLVREPAAERRVDGDRREGQRCTSRRGASG
jgi:hypothetical protein